MVLGIRAVLAKSFARIHRSNLISFGIAPLLFVEEEDYDRVDTNAALLVDCLAKQVKQGDPVLHGSLDGEPIDLALDLIQAERDTLLAGGLLNRLRR